MSKEYRLKNQQIKPLGRGLGGQLSNLGNALTVWDLGPRAKNESLRQAKREVFLNLAPGSEISAFQQHFVVKELTGQELKREIILQAVEPENSVQDAVEDSEAKAEKESASITDQQAEVSNPAAEEQTEGAEQPPLDDQAEQEDSRDRQGSAPEPVSSPADQPDEDRGPESAVAPD
jgi:hypothetical protein